VGIRALRVANEGGGCQRRAIQVRLHRRTFGFALPPWRPPRHIGQQHDEMLKDLIGRRVIAGVDSADGILELGRLGWIVAMTETMETSALTRPARRGQAWTIEEDRQLFDEFGSGHLIDAIALRHQRTPGGIHARLQLLGLIDKDGNSVDPPPPFSSPRERMDRREKDASRPMRVVFAATDSNGWRIEVRSNRLLDILMIKRLSLMLTGALVGQEGEVPFQNKQYDALLER
jgi:hypothetical protein